MRTLILVILIATTSLCFGKVREVAITLDDLPLVGTPMNTPENLQKASEQFDKIMQALIEYHAPATGFVIGESVIEGNMPFLERFRQAGFLLGNHTYTHYNLLQTSADKYIADIDRADKKLAPFLTVPKYFRYPYLAEGTGRKKQKILNYLTEHGYTIAPVTIDSLDFKFNKRIYGVRHQNREKFIERIKPSYLAYIWKQTLQAENGSGKQILLLHANLLNSHLLGDVLKMYKKHGYTFISLPEALKNPARAINFSPEGVTYAYKEPENSGQR